MRSGRRLPLVLACALLGTVPAAAQYVWNSGLYSLLDLPSPIPNGATLAIDTGADHDLSGQTLTNQGTITWNAGFVRGGNGAQIVNATGGVFNDRNGSSYTMFNPFGGGFSFTNQGSYVRDAGGMTAFDIPFDNAGTVDVQQGSIQFRAGGAMAPGGAMTTTTGTSIVFTAGYTLQTGSSLTGAGLFHHSSGTVAMDGAITLANYRQTGGTLTGTQTFSAGTYDWQAGSWNQAAATTTIADPATLNVTTGADHDFIGRTIVNHGVVNWHAGYLRGGNGSVFHNAADGVFHDLNASGYTLWNPVGGSYTFVNDGLYSRNTSGTTFFDIPLTNNGAIDLEMGSIQFRAGGTLSSTGTIDAAAGTSVVFTNGFNIQNGASLTGAGTYHLSNGALSVSGTINVGTLEQTGGALSGSQTFAGGTVHWQAGSWNGAADTTTIADGAVLNVSTGADHDFINRTIVNQGVVNWHAGYLRGGNGSVFHNAAGGVFNDLNASSYTLWNPVGGSYTFINDGLYSRNTGGTTFFDVPLTNNGLIDLDGGSMQFRAGGTLASTGSIDAATGTSVVFTNGFSVQDGASLAGGGTYHLAGGTLAVSGQVDVSTLLQTNGALAGSQTFGSGTVNWQAGSWNGTADTTILADPVVLNITTGADHDFFNRTIVNHGVVNWHAGYLRGGNGSVFHNAADGVFHDLNASGYTLWNPVGGSYTFINDGLYQRNTTGTTFFDIPITNNGVIDLDGGAIQFRAGGTLTAAGSIAAAPGTSVVFTNGFTIQNGASLTGTGAFQLTNGTLTLNGTVNVGSLLQTGGALAGAPTIGSGTYTWQSGPWNGTGDTITIAGPAVLNVTSGADHDFFNRTLVNHGVVNWHAGYLRGGNGSLFHNAAGGVFNDLNAGGYTAWNPIGGPYTFVNDGEYVRSVGGTTYFDVPFENGGTLVLEEGDLQLRAGATLEPTSMLRFVVGGPSTTVDYGLLSISSSLILDGQLQVTFANGYHDSILAAQTLTVVNSTGLTGAFTNVANGARLMTTDGFGSFQVNYGAGSAFAVNTVVLSNFQPVPEPSTWALLLLGGSIVAVSLHRQHRRTGQGSSGSAR